MSAVVPSGVNAERRGSLSSGPKQHAGHMLLYSGWNSDIEVRIGKKTYNLHQFILEASSTYFARIIEGTTGSKTLIKHSLRSRELQELIFTEKVIKLIYTKDFAGEIKSSREAIGVLRVSYELGFDEGAEECFRYLFNHATFEDILLLEQEVARDRSLAPLLLQLTNGDRKVLVEDKKVQLLAGAVKEIIADPFTKKVSRTQCEEIFHRNNACGFQLVNTRVIKEVFKPSELINTSTYELHPAFSWLSNMATAYCDAAQLNEIWLRESRVADVISKALAANPTLLSNQQFAQVASALKEVVHERFKSLPALLKRGEAQAETVERLVSIWGKRPFVDMIALDPHIVDIISSMRAIQLHHSFFEDLVSMFGYLPANSTNIVTQIEKKFKSFNEESIFEMEL